ncbi:uncharacterized protein BJX67DRAFT_383460 [Aspergillus lucknowensis]|uniref:Apple domain-containing protein n=1 Tax=Aspergillus lucknowensis TaxID=176173 RepID=A0ABR4LJX0_9EURO
MKFSTLVSPILLGALASAAPSTDSSAAAPAGLETANQLISRQSPTNATCAAEVQALDTCQQNLSTQLSECQAEQAAGSPFEDYARCPAVNDQTRNVGGVTYRQRCNQGIAQGTTILGSQDLRYDACLQACSANPSCQGVNYWPNNARPCLMFSQYNPNWGSRGNNYILIGALPTRRR